MNLSINRQTQGPLVASTEFGGSRLSPELGQFSMAFMDSDNHENDSQLLAAAFSAFDKAGRELGVDAVALAKTLDLTSLIQAAVAARESFHNLAQYAGDVDEWNEGGHAYEASQKVKMAINPVRDLIARTAVSN